jgi:[protein-PII] uridylyltransferase
MPQRYTAVNSPESILAHAKLVSRQLESGEAASVMLVPERRHGAVEVGIVAPDRVGLLAAIAAALAASRLNVHGAQIYSCELTSEEDGRLAVDLFWVHHSGGNNAVAGAVAKLERCLRAILSGDESAAALASRRRDGRRSVAGPQVQTKVIIDNRASPEHTVVEVLTRDRPGLLFELSNTIFEQGLSIAVAKIATEGTRAADVFYVSERDGKKVTVGERMEALRNALLLHIEGLDEAAS